MSELVRCPSLFPSEYAYAAVVPAGSQLVFAAGACPIDGDGAVVSDDVAEQAAQAMANLGTTLADAGATYADIVRTTVYVASTDRRDLVVAWQVIRDTLAPHDPPSTLLGVAVLGYPGQLVEVDAIAAVIDGWPRAS